jgi:hypothetical protein
VLWQDWIVGGGLLAAVAVNLLPDEREWVSFRPCGQRPPGNVTAKFDFILAPTILEYRVRPSAVIVVARVKRTTDSEACSLVRLQTGRELAVLCEFNDCIAKLER